MSICLMPDDSHGDELLQCALCSNTQLTDAVLLKCLHSACRACINDVSAHVTCPVCEVATETSAMKANLLVTGLVHHSLNTRNVFSCKNDSPQNKCDASSLVWCYSCQCSLCSNCEIQHNKYRSDHEIMHIDEEHTVLSELYRPPSRSCKEHGEELKHACFTCQNARCLKCAHDCYTALHDVQLLDSPDAIDKIKKKKEDIGNILSDLKSTDQLVQAHLSLPEKVASAVQDSQALLRNAKKTAIDSISSAYEKAERSLDECWVTIASKAELLRKSAENLDTRLVWTNRYCQIARGTEDVAALLPQFDTLHSRLRSLLDEAKQLKQPIDPLKLVNIKVCLPRDLDLITRDWIGEAILVNDSFDCSLEDNPSEVNSDYYFRRVATLGELEQHLQQQKKQQETLERQHLAVQQQELQLKLKEQQLGLEKHLRFNEKRRDPFEGPGKCCYDLAVTPHGRLLVAALSDGLKEYEAATFDEVSTWNPDDDLLGEERSVLGRVAIALSRIVSTKPKVKKSSSVCTVDSLTDGRVIVGLHSKLIVLLRRDTESIGTASSSQAWRVERCIAKLQVSPRHLSIWDDRLLAVLEDRYDERTTSWCCGPNLVLLSLSDGGKLLNRQKLDYDALSVALTDRVFVVASNCKVTLTDTASCGGEGATCYVVDCFSHLGVRLWRHAVDQDLQIMSVCSDSLGRAIYAAKWGSVVALSVDDGRELGTAVELSTLEPEQPYAIALGRTTPCLLALISEVSDQPNLITTFSVA